MTTPDKTFAAKYPGHRREMTLKQKKFFNEWCIDKNASRAAREAGYGEKYASSIGSKMLKVPVVRCAVEEFLADEEAEDSIGKPWIVKELKKCYRRFYADKQGASAVRCLESLIKLGGLDTSDGKNGGSPGADGKTKASDINLEDMSDEEKRILLERTAERLAHRRAPVKSG